MITEQEITQFQIDLAETKNADQFFEVLDKIFDILSEKFPAPKGWHISEDHNEILIKIYTPELREKLARYLARDYPQPESFIKFKNEI